MLPDGFPSAWTVSFPRREVGVRSLQGFHPTRLPFNRFPRVSRLIHQPVSRPGDQLDRTRVRDRSNNESLRA